MSDVLFGWGETTAAPAGRTGWHLAWQWLDRNQRPVLVAGLLLQLTVLVSMIAIHRLPLAVGKRVWVRVAPVDSRDPWSEHYVMLRYDFSFAPAQGIEGAPNNKSHGVYDYTAAQWLAGRPIYVSLEPDADGKHYKPVRWSVDRPASGLFLRGMCGDSFSWRHDLTFGIEAYYPQSGEQAALDAARAAGKLSAELAIAPWGQAKLVSVK